MTQYLQKLLLDVEGAVTGDFDDIFAREAVRGTEEGDNDFVERFAGGRVDDLAEGGGVGFAVG